MRVRAPAQGTLDWRRRRSLRNMWRCGALKTYVKLQYLANRSARSREFHAFPRTSRTSLHSSCFSFLGVFVAHLSCSLGSLSAWARSQTCAHPTGSVCSEWFTHGAHRRCAETRCDGAALRESRCRLPCIRYFSLGCVVKCADAAHCDARRPEIAYFSSARTSGSQQFGVVFSGRFRSAFLVFPRFFTISITLIGYR